LGEDSARTYQAGLERLLPAEMKESYPKASPAKAERCAEGVLQLVRRALEDAES